jgi:hypothetical protein
MAEATMFGEFIGATLMIHGLAGLESGDVASQAFLLAGGIAIVTRIRNKTRHRRR